ncbi:MAG: Holliday junction branch migration protein RuvA [Desulfovibrio sp.]|jgi:Holliday junction DNA helicase RuvA|nr:Holliday junction branch migration protein RuvA [Desulfovibrio sp.]
MIAYIEGRLLHVEDGTCVLVTDAGIGYGIAVSAYTLSRLPAAGERTALYISHVIREDAQALYGFPTLDERQTFDMLLTIAKVGPRTAISILSLYRPDDLRRIVLEDDAAALQRVSGVGKKGAQQIFLELKYKLKLEGADGGEHGSPQTKIFRDAVDGLVNLGYAEEECADTVRNVLCQEPDLDVPGALRAALKLLAKAKQDAASRKG